MAKKRQASKKYTPNQQAFLKEVARIEKYLKRKKAEHLYIPDFSVPTFPNRVTQKRLNEIKALTGRALSKKLKQIPVESVRIETKPDYIPPLEIQELQPPLSVFDWTNYDIPKPETPEPETQQDYGTSDDPNDYADKIEYDDTGWTKSDSTFSIITNFMEQMAEIPPQFHDGIQNLMQAWIDMYGADEVADAIERIPWKMRDFIRKNGSEFDFVSYNASFIQYIDVVDPGDKDYFEDIMSELISGECYA